MTTLSTARLTLPLSERDHILGSIDAPVAMVEYGDYECPHCGEAHVGVSQLIAILGENLARGKITIVNRAGLKDGACECYQSVNDEFDRLMGASPNGSGRQAPAPTARTRSRERSLILKEKTVSRATQTRLAGRVLQRVGHACAFFHDKEEEYGALLPFIREGFEHGDRALHVIDPHHRADHQRRLQEAGIDLEAAESSDRLEIRTWDGAYLQDGHFDQDRQLAWLEDQLQSGSAKGFPLTRFIANMEWALEDRQALDGLIEYESRINYLCGKRSDAICCTYNLARFSASVIMEVLRVHPAVVIGGIWQENPFYVPPDEFLRALRDKQ